MSDADWQPTAPLATLEMRARLLRAARDYFAATRTLAEEGGGFEEGSAIGAVLSVGFVKGREGQTFPDVLLVFRMNVTRFA